MGGLDGQTRKHSRGSPWVFKSYFLASILACACIYVLLYNQTYFNLEGVPVALRVSQPIRSPSYALPSDHSRFNAVGHVDTRVVGACQMRNGNVIGRSGGGEGSDLFANNPTIFGKILRKEIPAQVVHEDDKCLAFRDVNPVAPTHILIIPKKRIPKLSEANSEGDSEILAHLLITANKIANDEGLDSGYRIVINNGQHGCQTVLHLHVHLIGGKQLGWPPG